MNKFIKALQTDDIFTENGMPISSTSGNYVLDMFFKMGAARSMKEEEILSFFRNAMSEDANLALKALFYNRDIRGGQGERRSFSIMFRDLCFSHPHIAEALIKYVPEFGRWDDVLLAIGTPIEDSAINLIRNALFYEKNALCAKWMPRESKADGAIAKHLMTALGLSPRRYRRLLSSLSRTVESEMCSQKWNQIEYNRVPSIASKKYRNAFRHHDKDRYEKWLESLLKPESGNKIHAGAIFPNDIVKAYLGSPILDQTLEEQWKALPDYVPTGKSFIPVCDTSGSMTGDIAIEACLALGIYLSERNKGPFKEAIITFSDRPLLFELKGDTLLEKIRQMSYTPWGMNTDFEAVLRLILTSATRANLSQDDMPDTVLVLSDMQFDQCVKNPGASVSKMITQMYHDAGYEVPNFVFWNLRTSFGIPVKADQFGNALVSGFSPTIMLNLLGGELTPMSIMLKTLLSDRYKMIHV